MLLCIARNPHSQDPDGLLKLIESKIQENDEVDSETLDKSGFERMKLVMSQNPRMKVK